MGVGHSASSSCSSMLSTSGTGETPVSVAAEEKEGTQHQQQQNDDTTTTTATTTRSSSSPMELSASSLVSSSLSLLSPTSIHSSLSRKRPLDNEEDAATQNSTAVGSMIPNKSKKLAVLEKENTGNADREWMQNGTTANSIDARAVASASNTITPPPPPPLSPRPLSVMHSRTPSPPPSTSTAISICAIPTTTSACPPSTTRSADTRRSGDTDDIHAKDTTHSTTTAAAISAYAVDLTSPFPNNSTTSEAGAVDGDDDGIVVIDDSSSVNYNPNDNANANDNDNDNNDDEVCIIIPSLIQQQQQQPNATSAGATTDRVVLPVGHDDTMDVNDDDDDDDDIKVVSSTTVNPNIQYPHARPFCGVHKFDDSDNTTTNINNMKFCAKCYCVICDVPAKDCPHWMEHCTESKKPKINDDENDDAMETDEILLESPTTTLRDVRRLINDRNNNNNNNRRRLHYNNDVDDASANNANTNGSNNSNIYQDATNASKMRIVEVLSIKLSRVLEISEGGRREQDHQQHQQQQKKSAKKEDTKPDRLDNNTTTTTTAAKQDGDIVQLGLHPSFFVEGVKIGWPFPAIMLPQRQMAIHIIKGLKRGKHVVLESPTGTGKSVAILCSVLAWQRYHKQKYPNGDKQFDNNNNNNNPNNENEEELSKRRKRGPKIIYCSRTHSQVAQMVASLKKTPYRPVMTVLGSRERMCIHKELTGSTNKKRNKLPLNVACQTRRGNTDKERKEELKQFRYNDDNPSPAVNTDGTPRGGDERGENSTYHQQQIAAANDNDDDNNDANQKNSRGPPMTCPHYRQLSSERTAEMIVKQFIGNKNLPSSSSSSSSCGGGGGINSSGGCCGNDAGVGGGEESAFGVHDLEDLVRFGKNPYREDNIAIYRNGTDGKFGFTIGYKNKRKKSSGGCHILSLKDGGSATYEGRLQVGDTLLRVNGKDVRCMAQEKIFDVLKSTPSNLPARLCVLRVNSDTTPEDEVFDDSNNSLTALMQSNNDNGDGEQPEETYSNHSVCPYYLSRAIQPHAELTFAPYNYILDPGIRSAMGIGLDNTIVILDEAHNVESTLSESGSGKVRVIHHHRHDKIFFTGEILHSLALPYVYCLLCFFLQRSIVILSTQNLICIN